MSLFRLLLLLTLSLQVAFGGAPSALEQRLASFQQHEPSDQTIMINYQRQYQFVDNLNIDTSGSLHRYKRPLLREIVNVQAEIYLTWEALRRFFIAQFGKLLSPKGELGKLQGDLYGQLVFSRAQLRLKVSQIKWTQPLWSKMYALVKSHHAHHPVEMKQLNKTTPNWLELSVARELREQQASLDEYASKQSPEARAHLLDQADQLIDAHFECSHGPPLDMPTDLKLEQEPDWSQATPPLCRQINQRLELIRDYLDRKFVRQVIDNQVKAGEEIHVTQLDKVLKLRLAELEKFRLESIESNESDKKPQPPVNEIIDENSLGLVFDLPKKLDIPDHSE